MHVNVVNSYAATSLSVSVSFERSVDLPTEGKPTSPIRVSPDFVTSNPKPGPPLPPFGFRISRFNIAILAFSIPRCLFVALFFCVRAMSASISAIFCIVVIAEECCVRRPALHT